MKDVTSGPPPAMWARVLAGSIQLEGRPKIFCAPIYQAGEQRVSPGSKVLVK
jgi:hypothetical protein